MKTVSEVAEKLGKTRATIWLWIKLGKLKAEFQELPTKQKIWLIPESEVERLRGEDEREVLLTKVLVELIRGNYYSFYSLSCIKERLIQQLGENPDWLSNEWIGRTMMKLGFEKKSLGGEPAYRQTHKLTLPTLPTLPSLSNKLE